MVWEPPTLLDLECERQGSIWNLSSHQKWSTWLWSGRSFLCVWGDVQPAISSCADLHSFPQDRGTWRESLAERRVDGETSTVLYCSEISVYFRDPGCYRAACALWLDKCGNWRSSCWAPGLQVLAITSTARCGDTLLATFCGSVDLHFFAELPHTFKMKGLNAPEQICPVNGS